MNPKTANLDPKLREAYERIMGTSVPAPFQKVNTQTVSQTKPAENTPLPSQQTPKLQVEEVIPEPLEIPKAAPPPPPKPEAPSDEMVQSPVFNAGKNPFSQTLSPPADILANNTSAILNNDSPKKKGKLMPIILTLGGLVFFILYAVIWAKLFKLF